LLDCSASSRQNSAVKITDPGAALIHSAAQGNLHALGQLLVIIEPGIYNLAVRMLGNKDDAADACQEILLKVTTHLAGYRSEAAFTTWVYQVARNHLLNASTKSRESPVVSLDAMSDALKVGLELGASTWSERALLPEEKLAARQMAVVCTQGMLMRVSREERLAYLLDTVFGLPSDEAALVLDVTPAAYRKRLSRARHALEGFAQSACGLVNARADCRCEKQVHAVQVLHRTPSLQTGAHMSSNQLAMNRAEQQQASDALDELGRMSDMAGVLRAHPDWQAPERMREAIRWVLTTHTAGKGPTQ
jgi:RNA polymerase sigma factor (sigma-70 family)